MYQSFIFLIIFFLLLKSLISFLIIIIDFTDFNFDGNYHLISLKLKLILINFISPSFIKYLNYKYVY